ncbi:hypothetical protein Tco_0986606 [Tanacetum coccineum]
MLSGTNQAVSELVAFEKLWLEDMIKFCTSMVLHPKFPCSNHGGVVRAPKNQDKQEKAQKGVSLWKHQLPHLWCHVNDLVVMTGVIRQSNGLIMHSMAYSSQVDSKVPPSYTGNFMPLTLDLSFTSLDEFVNKLVVENRKSDEEVSEIVRKNDDAPIIEEWVSDSAEENVSQPKTEKKIVKHSIAKIEFVKPKQ